MRAATVLDPLRRRADAVLALALASALELQLLLADGRDVTPVEVVAGLALTLPLAWRRRAPLAVTLTFAFVAALQGVLGGSLYAGERPLLAALATGVVAFYSLAAHADDRPALLGLGLGVAGLWTTVSVSDHVDLQSYFFSAGIVALSPWLAGRATRARDQRAAALEREREERERAAASEERQRIARELHDVVAHGVVLMVLQAQGARRILDQDPERARAALGAIEETGQHALGELRRSLGLVRDRGASTELRPQPGIGDLGTLVEEMREVGLGVELRIEGEPRPLADAIDRSAYRIVQEALTNTIKHAGPVAARVTISYAPDDLRVEIADEGPGPPARGDGPGLGLAGMRERVRLYGGELDAHAGERCGFVVRARIPLGA